MPKPGGEPPAIALDTFRYLGHKDPNWNGSNVGDTHALAYETADGVDYRDDVEHPRPAKPGIFSTRKHPCRFSYPGGRPSRISRVEGRGDTFHPMFDGGR